MGDGCVREEDVLRFCFPDKEAIKPARCEDNKCFAYMSTTLLRREDTSRCWWKACGQCSIS